MKHLLAVLFVFFFVFSAYCSENNETDPLTSKDIEGPYIQKPSDSDPESIKSFISEDLPIADLKAEESVAVSMEKPAKAGRTIAVIPFDNMSDHGNALKEIMPQIKAGLEEKGYNLINEDIVEAFLCREKVRPASNISRRLAHKLRQETGADTVLMGSVVLFNTEDVPEVGILARLVDLGTGAIIWADYSSISGNDFTGILGLGTIKQKGKLIEKVKDKLLGSLKEKYAQNKGRSVHRIAVMPFQNKSGFVNAGIITTYMFLVELFKNNEFEPIEYGEVRELVVDKRVRAKGELRYENIDAILKTLDVDGVLVGTVEKYYKPANTSALPEVSISARLLTKGKSRILWYDSYHLTGDKKIIFFDWDSRLSVDRIAYKAVLNLIEKMESAKWPVD